VENTCNVLAVPSSATFLILIFLKLSPSLLLSLVLLGSRMKLFQKLPTNMPRLRSHAPNALILSCFFTLCNCDLRMKVLQCFMNALRVPTLSPRTINIASCSCQLSTMFQLFIVCNPFVLSFCSVLWWSPATFSTH